MPVHISQIKLRFPRPFPTHLCTTIVLLLSLHLAASSIPGSTRSRLQPIARLALAHRPVVGANKMDQIQGDYQETLGFEIDWVSLEGDLDARWVVKKKRHANFRATDGNATPCSPELPVWILRTIPMALALRRKQSVCRLNLPRTIRPVKAIRAILVCG